MSSPRPTRETNARPSILVAHPWMGRGGSEATAMWTLHALQDRFPVAFTSASPVNFEELNAVYGTAVSADKVRVLPAPRLFNLRSATTLVYWQHAWFERFCQKIGPKFDLCLSAYNPIYFGKPGIQLIGDFSFSEQSRRLLYPNANDRFCHRQSLLRRAYLSLGESLTGQKRPPLAERGDCAVANSSWTAGNLERIFGVADAPVLYPPSALYDIPENAERKPLSFVCLGRISPEKEIAKIIEILDRVREAGFPVTLDVVGSFDGSAYSERVRRLIARRQDWIFRPGFLDPAMKTELFTSRSFGIHGGRGEAFGIAIAEMAAAGLVPIVPASGGPPEIAHFPELRYENEEDAVKRIIHLLEMPEKIETYRHALAGHVQQFRPEAFMENLLQIIENFLGVPTPTSANDALVEKDHAAAY